MRRNGSGGILMRTQGMALVCLLGLTTTFAATVYTPMLQNLDGGGYSLFNILDFTAKGPWVDARFFNGGTLNSTTLQQAINYADNPGAGGNGRKGTVYLAPGVWHIQDNITVGWNVNLRFEVGAILAFDSGKGITIYGSIEAPIHKIFEKYSDNGTVNDGTVTWWPCTPPGTISEVYPQWWGTGNDIATGDDSPAIQRAIDSTRSGAGVPSIKIHLVGNYTCNTPININRHAVHLQGDGIDTTTITFNPPSGGPLFWFGQDGTKVNEIHGCSVRDLTIYSVPSTSNEIGIRITDGSFNEVRNVKMTLGDSVTSPNSIGLKIEGREFGFFENLLIQAGQPISITDNPRNSIDIDHHTFRNLYLVTLDASKANVTIDSGVNLTNVVFDGTQAWCMGKWGLYWNDTTSALCGNDLAVKNVRMEQETASGGYIIYISHNYALQNLILENIFGTSSHTGGVYLRKCRTVTVQNIFFSCPDTNAAALDIDNTSSKIVLINNMWQDGNPVRTGNLIRTFATQRTFDRNTDDKNRLIECWDQPDNPQGAGILIYGTKTWCYSGTIANAGSVSLSAPFLGSWYGTKVATVLVSAADSGTHTPLAGGSFVIGSGTTMVAGAGTNLSSTDVAGKLCLIGGGTVALKNNLGSAADVVVTIFWQ